MKAVLSALGPALLAALPILAPLPAAAQGVAPGNVEAAPSRDAEDLRPGPPPPQPDLSDPNARAAESLNEPGSGSDIPKSLRGSAAKSGGPANDLNPGSRRQEPDLPQPDLGAVAAGRELYHGNYCGAGDRGADLPPTDALDAACQRHDACYDAAGYRSCACDSALRREATAVSQRPDVALPVRRRALSVAEAADLMGCRTP